MKFHRVGVGLILCLSTILGPGAEVRLGNEVLGADGFRVLRGKRVGLITNPSGVNSHLETTVDVLRAAPSVKLQALFGPEHGIYGDVPAGDKVASRHDPRTGLPVHSLYGETRKPTPAMLAGLDAVVYDLQDTGCRSYTFISTMGEAMEACAENGLEFIVLDRPNPLGGERVEGRSLQAPFRSFVGRWDIPYVYGLTCGELARMIAGESWIARTPKLTVVPMQGWRRWMVWRDTGLPWAPTSPHVPHGDSPMFQVATGMLGELGGVSTGVGYTLPFECIARPGLNPQDFARVLNGYGLPGLRFKPIIYKPYYFTFKDEMVGGVQVYITDPRRAPLTAVNFYALEALKRTCGLDVIADGARTNRSFGMFDKVNGDDHNRLAVLSGRTASEITASWQSDEDAFRRLRRKYLLYK